jgi:hypothetical protein
MMSESMKGKLAHMEKQITRDDILGKLLQAGLRLRYFPAFCGGAMFI